MASRPKRKRTPNPKYQDFRPLASPTKKPKTQLVEDIPPRNCPGFNGSKCDNGGFVNARYNGFYKGRTGSKRKIRYDKLCPKHLLEEKLFAPSRNGQPTRQMTQVQVIHISITSISL